MVVENYETRTFDDLLTTTLDNYRATLFDNVFKSNPFFHKLHTAGRMRKEDGGASIIVPLMLGTNNTVDWYEGYDTIDVTPQEGFTVAKYPWCEMAGSVTMSRREERLNSGRHKLISLVEARIKQLEMSLIQSFNEKLFASDGGNYYEGSGSKIIASLQALVAEVPTSYNVGGVNATSNATWRNKAVGDAGTAFVWIPDMGDTPAAATGPVAMSTLYNACTKGEGGGPDLGVCSLYMFQQYEAGLHSLKRITHEGTAEAGFENLRFRRLDLFWDEYIASASVAASANEAAGGNVAYFLNTEFLELITDSESDFVRTPWVQPENQTARTMLMVWMGNLVTTNRRKHGVLTDGNITNVT
jgi:hypothetical protein